MESHYGVQIVNIWVIERCFEDLLVQSTKLINFLKKTFLLYYLRRWTRHECMREYFTLIYLRSGATCCELPWSSHWTFKMTAL